MHPAPDMQLLFSLSLSLSLSLSQLSRLSPHFLEQGTDSFFRPFPLFCVTLPCVVCCRHWGQRQAISDSSHSHSTNRHNKPSPRNPASRLVMPALLSPSCHSEGGRHQGAPLPPAPPTAPLRKSGQGTFPPPLRSQPETQGEWTWPPVLWPVPAIHCPVLETVIPGVSLPPPTEIIFTETRLVVLWAGSPTNRS